MLQVGLILRPNVAFVQLGQLVLDLEQGLVFILSGLNGRRSPFARFFLLSCGLDLELLPFSIVFLSFGVFTFFTVLDRAPFFKVASPFFMAFIAEVFDVLAIGLGEVLNNKDVKQSF